MKKTKRPNLITIGILSLVTILFWIGFSVYRVFTATAPIEVSEKTLSPLTPTLDTNTLEKVNQRTYFQEAEIPETLIIKSETAPIATGEAAQATEAAELEQ